MDESNLAVSNTKNKIARAVSIGQSLLGVLKRLLSDNKNTTS